MGGGIARSIREAFPAAYEADLRTPSGDRTKLGTCTSATLARADGSTFDVVNAYTQYDFRGPGPKLDYDALASAFSGIRQQHSGRRIGYPKIGAGLAGGDWSRIERIINSELAGELHACVILSAS